MELSPKTHCEKIKLTEINSYLTCYLCKGYFIDATTISECLHSFCRSCIIKFLQDNSYCPICEMIINKAKPNLKLDKTLQDIVYKLVPELFLREMTRRKLFYHQYPQIAARLTPEERGEDTERTIFNPQDCISLSMEYVSDDSAPNAIRLPEVKSGTTDKGLSPEENPVLMKRYLQCPGMCRVEVLKKFVRNKYNVDTNLFYIDILYKKVPLPDHYTLIDIAYIYSWKRNEPMKFFFRITDINKIGEKFDIFNKENPLELVVKPPVKPLRNTSDKIRCRRRKENVGRPRKNGKIGRRINRDKTENGQEESSGETSTEERIRLDDVTTEVTNRLKNNLNKTSLDKEINQENVDQDRGININNATIQNGTNSSIVSKNDDSSKLNNDNDPKTSIIVNESKTASDESNPIANNNIVSNDVETQNNDQENKENKNELDTSINNNKIVVPSNENTNKNHSSSNNDNSVLMDTDNSQQMKNEPVNENNEIRNPIYTNITLKRTNNVEIITKIQKVSNKEGQPIGLNIIKQTVRKSNSTKSGSNSRHLSKQSKITTSEVDKKSSSLENNLVSSSKTNTGEQTSVDDEEEKRLFLQSFELKAKNTIVSEKTEKIEKEHTKKVIIQKRKNSSPIKNDKPKKIKLDKKPMKRIIIQCKPKPSTTNVPTASQIPNALQNSGLQTLIENCKIPSSLSITIKETSDNNKQPTLPPVKNYIEILKLPDESASDATKGGKDNNAPTKLEFPLKMFDNDSEQKVDQDLAEIARSLTEKIPMSTTISQIIGHKQQFPIPTKSTIVSKQNILPSPVPELSSKLLNIPKDANKLSPRSPQTFQRIFEESIKKPDNAKSSDKDVQKNALDLTNEGAAPNNNSKRNILEIASQLYKKTKLELEKNAETTSQPVPKLPIPKLSQKNVKTPHKNLKFEIADSMRQPQTVTNLHSNALGLNYTVSVGPNTNASTKVNGTVTNIMKDNSLEQFGKPSVGVSKGTDPKIGTFPFPVPRDLPNSSPRPTHIARTLSPNLGYNSPRNSPKHSPKSSPVIKHMYAPTPNLLMDPLRVNTFNKDLSPKLCDISKQISPSGKHPSPSSTKITSSKLSPSSPKTNPSPSSSPKTPISSLSSASASRLDTDSTPGGSCLSSQAKPNNDTPTQMSPNQIMEKYNIQNLAQLTASLNFNTANFGMTPGNQLAALQQAMLFKHFEMQNRQNWLNMNQGPLLQYEKYLQSLKTNQNHLLSNIKEN